MQFEKINEDKIRIIFNVQDLKEKNIDTHDFMANSIATQSIFLEMLNQAEKEIGFVTDNHQLMIEALASSDGSFILTVTRSKKPTEPAIKKLKARPKVMPKMLPLNSPLPTLVYKFNTFDDFYDLCSFITEEHSKKLTKTFNKAILYSYNNETYLLLRTSPKADIKEVKHIISLVNEFSNNLVQTSEVFQNKLSEYGKVLVKNNCLLRLSNNAK